MKTVDPLSGISTFLAIAETLSFSKAGETLGISRATVSAQLGELEKRLGIRLLQRTTRSVALTEAGSAYLQALGGVLGQIREAERAATAYQKEAVGRLRVSAPPDLGSSHITPILTNFLQKNPAISIEMDLSYGAVNLIEQGFDLAIRATISVEPNLITRRIGASPLFVCASPDYLERTGAPQHPSDLVSHSCLHFTELRWGRVWHFRQGDSTSRVPILPRFEINDGRCLRQAAIDGAGITLLPSFIVGPDIRSGRLVPLFQDWEMPPVPLHAVYPANRHIAVKVRNFVAFLTNNLATHVDLRG
jgi:DNA-binding transcriptional LysR family regulator